MFTVNRNPSRADLHNFGWAMLGGFGLLGLAAWVVPPLRGSEPVAFGWTGQPNQSAAICLWALGVALFAAAFAPGSVARRVYVIWMSMVTPVGLVMSMVGLTLLFILLLPIFSLVVRFGDPLRRKLRKDGSYWEDYKPYEPTMERMKRLF